MKVLVKVVRDKDGYFRSWCPTLPGCFAYGQTQEESQARLKSAVEGYLASLDVVVPEKLEHDILSA